MARILVIDDDEVITGAMLRILEYQGHEVHIANDGKRGASLYRENIFDLIITDIYMPEMDGLEIVLDIAKAAPNTKVIAISGEHPQANLSYLEVARKFGASRILRKPFDWDELLRMVKEMLEEPAAS